MRKHLRTLKLHLLDTQYKLFAPSKWANWKANKNLNWLFIIGCNNSGTTLLKNILGSYHLVKPIEGEGQYRTKALPTDRGEGVARVFSEKLETFRLTESDDGNYLRVFYDWYHHIKPNKDCHYILEKTTVNSLRTRWLQHHFPKAHFIIIFRRPYGVCEGMKRKANISIEQAAKHWEKTNSILFNDLNFLKHKLIVTYDEFTESPIEVINKIEEFLLLTDGNNDNVHNRVFRIHGKESKIRNMDKESINRLSEEECKTIKKICGKLEQEIFQNNLI